MNNINKKAICYGYLAYFIPGFVLTFIGLEFQAINFAFLILGGYIAAKLSPKFEMKNSFAVGCLAFAFSLLMIALVFTAAEQNIKISTLLSDVLLSALFCMSASVLGGSLRRIELQRNKA